MDRIERIELAALTQGVGSPLVFLHGWATDKTVWLYQRKFFHRRYGVVMPDLRGYGFSVWQPAEDLLSAMVDDVAWFLESRQIGPSTIIGWSLGGQLALRIAVEKPEWVKSLVLVSTTPKFISDKEFPYGHPVAAIRKLAQDIRQHLAEGIHGFYLQLFSDTERKNKAFDLAYEILEQCVLPSEAAALAGLELLKVTDLRPDLEKVKVPTLIIHGCEDTICPPGAAEYMAKRIPEARLEWLEHAGHVPHLTHPEEFNCGLERFLKQRKI